MNLPQDPTLQAIVDNATSAMAQDRFTMRREGRRSGRNEAIARRLARIDRNRSRGRV